MQFTAFLRKIAQVPEIKTEHVGSEIGEKRTTLLGYVLLIAMVIVGFGQGQSFINKIAENIDQPQAPSACVEALRSQIDLEVRSLPGTGFYYYGFDTFRECKLTPYELSHGVAAIVAEVKPLLDERHILQSELDTLNASLSGIDTRLRGTKSDYDLSLQEAQAGVPNPIFVDKGGLQANIGATSAERDQLVARIAPLTLRVKELDAKVRDIAVAHQAEIKAEYTQYERELAWANTLRALLELVFLAPLFYFALRRYFIAEGKRAFTAIIWAAVTTIFALLFAQVVAVFIYDIIPHALIEVLLKFFAQFKFIASIAQYLLLILVPALFGGIVYLIQKRVYGGRAVYLRAMKTMKCPNCSMHLRDDMRFCPVCGFQVKEKCPSCGVDRYKGLEHCDKCGVKVS